MKFRNAACRGFFTGILRWNFWPFFRSCQRFHQKIPVKCQKRNQKIQTPLHAFLDLMFLRVLTKFGVSDFWKNAKLYKQILATSYTNHISATVESWEASEPILERGRAGLQNIQRVESFASKNFKGGYVHFRKRRDRSTHTWACTPSHLFGQKLKFGLHLLAVGRSWHIWGGGPPSAGGDHVPLD